MHLSTVEALLEYQVEVATHICFSIEAAHWPTQAVLSEQLDVSSAVHLRRFADEASGTRFFRVDAPAGRLRVHYKAEVEVHSRPVDGDLAEVPVAQLPDAMLRYLLPTRYCESDLLAPAARQLFAGAPPGIARVRRVAQWIHEHIAYRPGSTTSTTGARQVFEQRAGVCRALNIPARIVVGYVWFAEPPQDFHAIFEAWLGGRWVLFDPTGMAPVDRLVRIGTGRDASEVAFSTFFGAVEMTRMEVKVLEHEPRSTPNGGEAVVQAAVGA